MASTHKHLRSSTANKRPTTSIADGQIALNTNSTSPGLFFKDSTGATIIKVGPVHVGTTAPNVSPASGGSTGNSTGEVWLDTSLTPNGVKIWNGSSWTNATPIGSTTVQGLLELATSAETQAGTDTDRAVTPAGLQSKLSDSTSTTSSTTIASSTAVKAAYDLADAALPKAGGTITGALEIGTTGSLVFEGTTADAFETTIAVTDPTADRTITLPNQTGTVIVSGNASIVDADISASAEIAVSKLADGAARQLLQTDAAGTDVEWTSNVDIPGTLDVTGATTLDSTLSFPLGSAGSPSLYPGADTNTGIWSPAADTIAVSTGGSERARIKANGNLGVGASDPKTRLHVNGTAAVNAPTIGSVSANAPLYVSNFDTNYGLVAGTSTVDGHVWLQAQRTDGTATAYNITLNEAAGNVGVGTSTPIEMLHVAGNTVIGGAPATRYSNFTVVGTAGIQHPTPLLNLVNTNGSDRYGYLYHTGLNGTLELINQENGNLNLGTNNGVRVIIGSDGSTTLKGAGTTSGGYSLITKDNSNVSLLGVRNDGALYMGMSTLSPYNLTTASAANAHLSNDGYLYRSTSSLKYKSDIQDAHYGLDELLALRPVTYKEKRAEDEGSKRFGGLIAEEVDAAGLSEFVEYALDGSPDALAYGNMVSLCIKAIQEQQDQIKELQAKVAALEAA